MSGDLSERKSHLTRGCKCGAVRYTISDMPIAELYGHDPKSNPDYSRIISTKEADAASQPS